MIRPDEHTGRLSVRHVRGELRIDKVLAFRRFDKGKRDPSALHRRPAHRALARVNVNTLLKDSASGLRPQGKDNGANDQANAHSLSTPPTSRAVPRPYSLSSHNTARRDPVTFSAAERRACRWRLLRNRP